jgi:opacity protein-like surface antigen
MAIVLVLVAGLAGSPVQAAEHLKKGWYGSAGIGAASSDVSAAQFERGLTDAGYSVSGVTLDDDSSGWKATIGYMINDHVGIQASYVDLGRLNSEFTASVPPDEIAALLEEGTRLLPGRGRGFLADVLLQFPFSDRVAIYGTLGVFVSEPESEQTVVSGGTGTAKRTDEDTDFAGSIGLSFAVSDRVTIKVAYERYEIDGHSTDFPMAAVAFGFGKRDD